MRATAVGADTALARIVRLVARGPGVEGAGATAGRPGGGRVRPRRPGRRRGHLRHVGPRRANVPSTGSSPPSPSSSWPARAPWAWPRPWRSWSAPAGGRPSASSSRGARCSSGPGASTPSCSTRRAPSPWARCRVTDVVGGDVNGPEVLARAAAAEVGSEHPVGRAVVAGARQRGLDRRRRHRLRGRRRPGGAGRGRRGHGGGRQPALRGTRRPSWRRRPTGWRPRAAPSSSSGGTARPAGSWPWPTRCGPAPGRRSPSWRPWASRWPW